jgi:hypothetical protein
LYLAVYILNESGIKYKILIGFEILTAVVIKSVIFWDKTPCSPLKVNRRFGEKYRLYFKAEDSTFHLFFVDFLLGLFFGPEDGGDIFLLNVGLLSTDHMTLYPRR